MSNFERSQLDDYVQRTLSSPKSTKSDRRIFKVHFMDLIESRGANDNRLIIIARGCASTQPSISTLRHD